MNRRSLVEIAVLALGIGALIHYYTPNAHGAELNLPDRWALHSYQKVGP